MSQLSSAMRDNIVSAALQARFRDRKAGLVEQETALALRYYDMIFPAAIVAAASNLPANWLRRDRCLRFQVGYRNIVLNVSDDVLGPLVPSGDYGCRVLGLIDEEAAGAFEDFERAKNQLEKDIRDAEQALRGLLASCRTMKQLRDSWPEGAVFYRQFEEVRAGLPAVTSEKVNALFGLPAATAGVTT